MPLRDAGTESRVAPRLVNSVERCQGGLRSGTEGPGTVCDGVWDSSDANVVCGQLGSGGARSALGSVGFGQGSGPIYLGDVRCSGHELHL